MTELKTDDLALPIEAKGGWMHAPSPCASRWSGVYETKEYAINEGRAEYFGSVDERGRTPEDCFYIAHGDPVNYDDVYESMDSTDVLSAVNEYMYDNDLTTGDEVACSFVDPDRAELEFKAWLRRNVVISPCCVVDQSTIVSVPAVESHD